MRRLACFVVLLALPWSISACGGQGRYGKPAHNAERVTVAGTEVSEDAFAGAVRDLLASEPNSHERELRLQGVIGRQMIRVATRFKAKDRERAVASLQGAMYLVHAGELKSEMLGSRGHEALEDASDEFAKRGDEGRARAMYEMLSRIAPAKDKADIKAHLDAIKAWTKDTSGGGVMQTAGALEAAAVTRQLLEPSKEARDDALARTLEFVEKAAAIRTARRVRGTQVSREEGLEAVRALETGATVLAAIQIRNADAQGARTAIDKVKDVARPELLHALDAVIEKPDSDRWLDLARMLRPPTRQAQSEDEDFGRDTELLRVASFAAAAEAYRLDTTSPEPAAFVAAMLVDLGMGEAAPAVLVDAVKAQRDPRIVGLGLAITMQAMGRALEADEPDGVRRAFRAAAPILAVADSPAQRKIVQPSPARVYGMMGEIGIREGRLADARTYLTASVNREKAGSILLSLARLDWHDGQVKAAEARLTDALASEDVAKDPALRGEVLLLESDITREAGDAGAARKPLSDALRDLAKARGAADGDDRARIERLIARALDRFGAGTSAMKALDRALEAAPHDKRQSAATIGQIVGRAFVKGDLASARDGLTRGLGAELPREDIVYYAMWVRFLERQQPKVTTDTAAEHVLLEAASDPRWIGRIAAFGAGKLKDADLIAAAQTPTQKTEALFYTALDRRAAGDAKGANEALKQVVASPGIDLMEVALARELLSGTRAQIGGPVPEVGLPSITELALTTKHASGTSFGDSRGLRRSIDWGSLAPLRIRARMVAEGVYAGAHRSARKGAGVEFGGHRAYTPGDDLRWLDVRSLLRHDHLLVRQFETETDRALRLVVDATASMGYRGKAAPGSKVAWASLVAAALARVAIRSGNPVGLGFIGGAPQSRGVPVSGGREAFERVVDALEGQRAEGDALANLPALDRALGALARAARRGSVVVVLSDLLDLPPEAPERIAAIATRGRVVVVVQTLDPDEATFPFKETVRLVSLEGDAVVETDEAARERYLAALAELQDSWRRTLVGRGASFLTMTTDRDPVAAVRSIIEVIR